MKLTTVIPQLVVAILLAAPGATFGTVIEVGDLNIISDFGNPSDGLRFLDMTFSDGLTQSAALTNAQATYSNARLATPGEFDDLFAAAGIGYLGSSTASDAFVVGPGEVISTGALYDSGVLASQLGFTDTQTSNRTLIWTNPDGLTTDVSFRDVIDLLGTGVIIGHTTVTPPDNRIGWLLVSQAVPEPSSFMLLGMGAVGFFGYGWRRRRKASNATS